MNFYSRRHLPHTDSYLYEFEPNRIKLRFGKLRASKIERSKHMHNHISYRVKKQPKLVGFKTHAGSPVREEMVLMFLDEKLHIPSNAVGTLINKLDGSLPYCVGRRF